MSRCRLNISYGMEARLRVQFPKKTLNIVSFIVGNVLARWKVSRILSQRSSRSVRDLGYVLFMLSLERVLSVLVFLFGVSLMRRQLRIVPTPIRSMMFLRIKPMLELGVPMAQERRILNRFLFPMPNLLCDMMQRREIFILCTLY
jgi:hypothetical protein